MCKSLFSLCKLQVQNLGFFRWALELEAQPINTEVRFCAKLFIFDKGIIVTSVVGKHSLQFRCFFDKDNVLVQISSNIRFDLLDRKHPYQALALTVEPMKITDLKKIFDNYTIETQSPGDVLRSPKVQKSKKIIRPQGKRFQLFLFF